MTTGRCLSWVLRWQLIDLGIQVGLQDDGCRQVILVAAVSCGGLLPGGLPAPPACCNLVPVSTGIAIRDWMAAASRAAR
jgi:hypothetical protein